MLELAKAIHQAIGIDSPRAFIALFALLGFLFFGGLGWIIDRGYRIKVREEKVQAAAINTPPKSSSLATRLAPEFEPKPPLATGQKESYGTVHALKKEVRIMPDESKINQTMTNSPGGTQVAGNLTVNVNAGRRLTEIQKQLLVGEMSKSVGTNGSGLITCILGDPESTALGPRFC
jgi:hypothetical protein